MINNNTTAATSRSKFPTCLVNVRTLVLALFLLVTSVASAQNDTLFIHQGTNYSSIQTGSSFIDTVNYSWSSFTKTLTSAVATLTLPQNLVPYVISPFANSVIFDPSQVSAVTYNAGSRYISTWQIVRTVQLGNRHV